MRLFLLNARATDALHGGMGFLPFPMCRASSRMTALDNENLLSFSRLLRIRSGFMTRW